MTTSLTTKRLFYFSLSFIAIALVLVSFYFDGTGGGGDSTWHYQYSRFAHLHPENFFNHWGKPVYTILAFPFTQLGGFKGVMIFNILLSLISCVFTYKTLNLFKTANSHFIAIILFSINLYVTVTLSGLTEPLSAAMLMVSIYLITKGKNILGLTIISFLPFVRSEGLIILSVFFIYLIISKKIKFIPLLVLGHIIMSIIGSFFYHDLLWVFNKIPYANLGSAYGKGTWFHFIEQLFFQMGVVEYSLLILGGIAMVFTITKKSEHGNFFSEKLWLVYGCFMAFFVLHTSFWALGIFNSMGLSRVFVFVMPLMAIIVLDGLNFIAQFIAKWNTQLSQYVTYLLIAFMVILPFLNGPSSYKIPDDFELAGPQKVIKNTLIPYLNKYQKDKSIVIADVGISFFLDVDPFDKKVCKMFYDVHDFSTISNHEVIIWDNWFAPVELATPLEKLSNNESLKMDTSFFNIDNKGRAIQFVVFSKK